MLLNNFVKEWTFPRTELEKTSLVENNEVDDRFIRSKFASHIICIHTCNRNNHFIQRFILRDKMAVPKTPRFRFWARIRAQRL